MAENFEDRDLTGATFWGVRLNGALFRDAALDGSTFFHTLWRNVTIDGEIDGLVVNGVDVTEYVNQHDRWFPLRNRLSPDDLVGVRWAWEELSREWSALMSRVSSADPSVLVASVDGEWSLRDTLRHLLFAMDKWCALPLLGGTAFHPMGLPNTGSQGRAWPGIDTAIDPGFDDVVRERGEQHARFTSYLASIDDAVLSMMVDVEEMGQVSALMCCHVVLEEEFEHLRYALRDLSRLGVA